VWGGEQGLVAEPVLDRSVDPATAELLDQVLARIEPHIDDIVDDFYDRLAARPVVSGVLARLTAQETGRLKARQADHVRLMLSSGHPAEHLQARSREVGRIHAMVGVEMDWYVDAVADHRRGIMTVLGQHAEGLDLAAAYAVLTERFMSDLHSALLGFRDLDTAQNQVMLRIIETVAEACTVADLARGVVDALATLDGVAICLFARPDDQGQMQYEFGAGETFESFVQDVNLHGQPRVLAQDEAPEGGGPIGRSWRTGTIQRCDSYATDPAMAPWRPLAEQLGWRSSASMPLAGRRGASRAVITVQARWPGYFASTARRAMLEQVKQSVERALADLEERPTLASGVSGYSDRRTHLARLAAGQVEMLFQPVVSLPDGQVTKLEALARLRSDDGLVAPAEFLPAFGDDELFELFDIGLHQSFDAMRAWERDGLRAGVSVNLPVVSVYDDRYVRRVGEALEEYAVDPARLTLELLETGFVDRETHRRQRFLDDFKELGVRLAQDDLGSGYSSLLRLRHFAFDEVKIDQSLVRGSELAPGVALNFIEPITDIAHSLGLHVVIEGLENDGLIEAALHLGVDAGQGYGIARPMPAGDVVAWSQGFRVGVHPGGVPQHALGALASHISWEHRVAALGDHPARASLFGMDSCPLTAYLDRLGQRELVADHELLHHAVVSQRGGGAHRALWQRLAGAVVPAT
jgi:EAL domain-containing protein (putative c-di-GMP-specific phosphodiesterase class I)